jgi:hypothetical protein
VSNATTLSYYMLLSRFKILRWHVYSGFFYGTISKYNVLDVSSYHTVALLRTQQRRYQPATLKRKSTLQIMWLRCLTCPHFRGPNRTTMSPSFSHAQPSLPSTSTHNAVYLPTPPPPLARVNPPMPQRYDPVRDIRDLRWPLPLKGFCLQRQFIHCPQTIPYVQFHHLLGGGEGGGRFCRIYV